MAIDELTDEAFFDLYRNNSQIKGVVDNIQKEYHVHKSQEGTPDYNPRNREWIKEAKSQVGELLAQQKEGKTNAASSGVFSGKISYATGLLGVLAIVAALSAGLPPITYAPPLY